MAMQVKKSGLMAKYGNKLNSAVQQHASDPTEYGRINLPPGIDNGIARLIVCKFDTYKTGDYKGEYYCRMAGVIVEPTEVSVKGTPVAVAGQQTSQMMPCCDTKNKDGKVTDQHEHIAKVLNEFRKLAGDEFTKGATGEDLERLGAALELRQPFFRFSTSVKLDQNTKEPNGVWENWSGGKGLENFSVETPNAVEDSSAAPPTEEPKPPAATPVKGATKAPAKAAAPAKSKEPEPEDLSLVEEEEILQLVEKAKEEDKEAQERLTAIAIAKGIEDQAANDAASWEALANMIAALSAPAADDTPAAWLPAVDEVYGYSPPNTKNPKIKLPLVECSITAVDEAKETVNLKNVKNPKVTYKAVAWVSLETAPD